MAALNRKKDVQPSSEDSVGSQDPSKSLSPVKRLPHSTPIFLPPGGTEGNQILLPTVNVQNPPFVFPFLRNQGHDTSNIGLMRHFKPGFLPGFLPGPIIMPFISMNSTQEIKNTLLAQNKIAGIDKAVPSKKKRVRRTRAQIERDRQKEPGRSDMPKRRRPRKKDMNKNDLIENQADVSENVIAQENNKDSSNINREIDHQIKEKPTHSDVQISSGIKQISKTKQNDVANSIENVGQSNDKGVSKTHVAIPSKKIFTSDHLLNLAALSVERPKLPYSEGMSDSALDLTVMKSDQAAERNNSIIKKTYNNAYSGKSSDSLPNPSVSLCSEIQLKIEKNKFQKRKTDGPKRFSQNPRSTNNTSTKDLHISSKKEKMEKLYKENRSKMQNVKRFPWKMSPKSSTHNKTGRAGKRKARRKSLLINQTVNKNLNTTRTKEKIKDFKTCGGSSKDAPDKPLGNAVNESPKSSDLSSSHIWKDSKYVKFCFSRKIKRMKKNESPSPFHHNSSNNFKPDPMSPQLGQCDIQRDNIDNEDSINKITHRFNTNGLKNTLLAPKSKTSKSNGNKSCEPQNSASSPDVKKISAGAADGDTNPKSSIINQVKRHTKEPAVLSQSFLGENNKSSPSTTPNKKSLGTEVGPMLTSSPSSLIFETTQIPNSDHRIKITTMRASPSSSVSSYTTRSPKDALNLAEKQNSKGDVAENPPVTNGYANYIEKNGSIILELFPENKTSPTKALSDLASTKKKRPILRRNLISSYLSLRDEQASKVKKHSVQPLNLSGKSGPANEIGQPKSKSENQELPQMRRSPSLSSPTVVSLLLNKNPISRTFAGVKFKQISEHLKFNPGLKAPIGLLSLQKAHLPPSKCTLRLTKKMTPPFAHSRALLTDILIEPATPDCIPLSLREQVFMKPVPFLNPRVKKDYVYKDACYNMKEKGKEAIVSHSSQVLTASGKQRTIHRVPSRQSLVKELPSNAGMKEVIDLTMEKALISRFNLRKPNIPQNKTLQALAYVASQMRDPTCEYHSSLPAKAPDSISDNHLAKESMKNVVKTAQVLPQPKTKRNKAKPDKENLSLSKGKRNEKQNERHTRKKRSPPATEPVGKRPHGECPDASTVKKALKQHLAKVSTQCKTLTTNDKGQPKKYHNIPLVVQELEKNDQERVDNVSSTDSYISTDSPVEVKEEEIAFNDSSGTLPESPSPRKGLSNINQNMNQTEGSTTQKNDKKPCDKKAKATVQQRKKGTYKRKGRRKRVYTMKRRKVQKNSDPEVPKRKYTRRNKTQSKQPLTVNCGRPRRSTSSLSSAEQKECSCFACQSFLMPKRRRGSMPDKVDKCGKCLENTFNQDKTSNNTKEVTIDRTEEDEAPMQDDGDSSHIAEYDNISGQDGHADRNINLNTVDNISLQMTSSNEMKTVTAKDLLSEEDRQFSTTVFKPKKKTHVSPNSEIIGTISYIAEKAALDIQVIDNASFKNQILQESIENENPCLTFNSNKIDDSLSQTTLKNPNSPLVDTCRNNASFECSKAGEHIPKSTDTDKLSGMDSRDNLISTNPNSKPSREFKRERSMDGYVEYKYSLEPSIFYVKEKRTLPCGDSGSLGVYQQGPHTTATGSDLKNFCVSSEFRKIINFITSDSEEEDDDNTLDVPVKVEPPVKETTDLSEPSAQQCVSSPQKDLSLAKDLHPQENTLQLTVQTEFDKSDKAASKIQSNNPATTVLVTTVDSLLESQGQLCDESLREPTTLDSMAAKDGTLCERITNSKPSNSKPKQQTPRKKSNQKQAARSGAKGETEQCGSKKNGELQLDSDITDGKALVEDSQKTTDLYLQKLIKPCSVILKRLDLNEMHSANMYSSKGGDNLKVKSNDETTHSDSTVSDDVVPPRCRKSSPKQGYPKTRARYRKGKRKKSNPGKNMKRVLKNNESSASVMTEINELNQDWKKAGNKRKARYTLNFKHGFTQFKLPRKDEEMEGERETCSQSTEISLFNNSEFGGEFQLDSTFGVIYDKISNKVAAVRTKKKHASCPTSTEDTDKDSGLFDNELPLLERIRIQRSETDDCDKAIDLSGTLLKTYTGNDGYDSDLKDDIENSDYVSNFDLMSDSVLDHTINEIDDDLSNLPDLDKANDIQPWEEIKEIQVETPREIVSSQFQDIDSYLYRSSQQPLGIKATLEPFDMDIMLFADNNSDNEEPMDLDIKPKIKHDLDGTVDDTLTFKIPERTYEKRYSFESMSSRYISNREEAEELSDTEDTDIIFLGEEFLGKHEWQERMKDKGSILEVLQKEVFQSLGETSNRQQRHIIIGDPDQVRLYGENDSETEEIIIDND